MKKRFLLALTIYLTTCYSILSAQVPQIIAHRGYWKAEGTAQNSLAALNAAYQFHGICGVECDARLTADDVFIVYHDSEIDGELIENKPYSWVKEHLLSNGETIPTLDEFLDPNSSGHGVHYLFKKCRIVLEIKAQQDKNKTKTSIQKTLKLIKDYQSRDGIEVISFDLNVCKAIAKKCPKIPVAYLGGDKEPAELHKMGIDGIDYNYKVLREHPAWVEQAHALGMTVNVWTVNSREIAEEMVKLGVDQITTDEPAYMPSWIHNEPIYSAMSFNIRMSGAPKHDGVHAWENRKEAVVKMLNDVNPDIIGVQEMLPDQQKYLRANLPAYDMVGVGRDDGKNEGECMAIFYKRDLFNLIDERTFWLSETPDTVSFGWDAACRRTLTYARLQVKATGQEILFFNTHLDHVGQVARRESVKLISQIINTLRPNMHAFVLLCGDMNSNVEDSIFAPLADIYLTQPRNFLKQNSHADTYNAFGKEGNAFSNNNGARIIDHFFTYKQLNLLQLRTITNDYGVPYISDHYPIVLNFSLQWKPSPCSDHENAPKLEDPVPQK